MDRDSKADCKIHILYLVKRAPGVSYQQLMDKCMESLYIDFFNFSDAYSELISGNLMNREVGDTGTGEVIGTNEILTITEAGDAILSDVEFSLNDKTRGFLDRASTELNAVIVKTNAVKAHIIGETDGTYIVDLIDNVSGINIKIKAETSDKAEQIASNWRANSSDISAFLTDKLLKN